MAPVEVTRLRLRAELRSLDAGLALLLLLLAIGAGPLYVGAVSDWLKPGYGAESLRYALYALVPFFILGIGCNVAASVMLARRARKSVAAA